MISATCSGTRWVRALSAIGSPIGKIRIDRALRGPPARFDRALDLAELYETPRIRVFSFYMPPGDDPAAHRARGRRADERAARPRHGRRITLLLENEKGIYGDTARPGADILETVDSPALAHAFDPANYVEVGQNIDEAWRAAAYAGEALPRQGL